MESESLKGYVRPKVESQKILALYKNYNFKRLRKSPGLNISWKTITMTSPDYIGERYFFPFVLNDEQKKQIGFTIAKGEGNILFGVLGFWKIT